MESLVTILKHGKAFLYLEQEIPDFTKKDNFNLVIMGPNSIFKIPFKEDSIFAACNLLEESVFSTGIVNICWDIKNLFSNTLYYKRKLKTESKIYDLKVIEAYLGKNDKRPASYQEAMSRIKMAAKHQDKWSSVYQKIHLPLIIEIIPGMEIIGVIDKNARKKLHAYYEIEGQKNGRLNCSMVFKNGFNPHHLGHEEREVLVPIGENKVFINFDFRFMEVVVLQWLSKDEKLGNILNTKNDFFKEIFKLLMGKECENDQQREFCKKIFLPAIFGLSAKTISEKFKKSDKIANYIINTLESNFPTAFSFVKENQHKTELSDYLGRTRKFEKDSPAQRRNFLIQSPASTVCYEKLIKIKNIIKNEAQLGFHVHDGYYLYVNKSNYNYVYNLVKPVLESPSELLAGLKLRVSCKVGPTLNSLTSME
jgi:DNA polymerase I-like protein with 3'-5' exonuclease and polymerase domains